jgi:hypothetical protein
MHKNKDNRKNRQNFQQKILKKCDMVIVEYFI